MALTERARWWLKWQGYLSALLMVAIAGLSGFLSNRYEFTLDWTAVKRHTLSEASRAVLSTLDGPVVVTAFVSNMNPLHEQIRFLVDRYQRLKHDISVEFVDPDKAPDRVRSAGVRFDGEMIISYRDRQQHIDTHDEQTLTSALQSLARGGERWIVFAQGHGERDPGGVANHDLGQFGEQLKARGFKIQSLVLGAAGAIPDNTTLLVIASPQADWLAAEVTLVRSFIERGGNVLLLMEPGPQHGLEPLLTQLGVTIHPGTIVDPTTAKLNIENAAMTVIARYPKHPATEAFNVLTVFPYAAGLEAQARQDWEAAPLLQTADGAWSETGAMDGDVAFDEATDSSGPLDIAVTLTRAITGTKDKRQQRVLIVGDGDFLANSYLGNSGNLDLGMRIITWLTGDDSLITIPARTAPDATLDLSRGATLLIGLGFFIVLPLALLATGAAVWVKRRRR